MVERMDSFLTLASEGGARELRLEGCFLDSLRMPERRAEERYDIVMVHV